MYLLPKEHPAMRKIMESYPAIPCDIYTDIGASSDGAKQQIDDFIRYLELYLNKIKKINCSKTTSRVSVLYGMLLGQYFFLFGLIEERPLERSRIGLFLIQLFKLVILKVFKLSTYQSCILYNPTIH